MPSMRRSRSGPSRARSGGGSGSIPSAVSISPPMRSAAPACPWPISTSRRPASAGRRRRGLRHEPRSGGRSLRRRQRLRDGSAGPRRRLPASGIGGSGLVGEHPAGFDTCRFDEAELRSLAGIAIDRSRSAISSTRAAAAPADAVAARRGEVAGLKGIGEVDQQQLAKSLSLFEGLAALKDEKGLSAFAVRCWRRCSRNMAARSADRWA